VGRKVGTKILLSLKNLIKKQGGKKMSSPFSSVLNQQEILQIKAATLDLLENVGIVISYQPALEALRHAGARVEGERVYFPPKIVEESVAKAPRSFVIHGRNPEKNVTVGAGSMVMAPGYGAPFLTEASGLKRKATLKDFQDIAILSGASSNMNISGGPLVEPCDVPDSIRHKVMLYNCMKASDKPFMGSATGAEHANDSLEMAAMLFGSKETIMDKPVMITLINSLTPLTFDERMTGALMVHAAAGQPVIITSLGMAGSTTPTTLASALVMQNSEVLAGITLAQIVREGTPVVYGSASSITEMRYGSLSIGCPEGAWIIGAAAQIAHSYGLPCRAGGCLTDSKIPDAQAAWESMMNLQMVDGQCRLCFTRSGDS
jgi:trimethylamine--corrinoid protein Co-methyltransferase